MKFNSGKCLILVLVFFSLFLSFGCVCATDGNNTDKEFSLGSLEIPSLDKNLSVHVLGDDDSVYEPIQRGTFADLQKEINDAKYGAVLDLNRDYHANGGSTIQLNKDLTIDGHGHTLDCEKVCSAFHSSKGNIILKNINIINGFADEYDGLIDIHGEVSGRYGGAILFEGLADRCPYILNCTFSNNEAGYGGAIANCGSRQISKESIFDIFLMKNYPVLIENCTFSNNKADYAGAIYSLGNLTIRSSVLKNNVAKKYGAVSVLNDAEIYDSSFYQNRAEEECAGAIGNVDDGVPLLLNRRFVVVCGSSFCGNTAETKGGAIYADNIEFRNSTFNANYADDCGGAFYANTVTYVNYMTKGYNASFFINNKAGNENGGAIYTMDYAYVDDATFSGNGANVDGGAIYSEGSVDAWYCLFESNKADGAIVHQCYGGAICGKEVSVVGCTFRKNYAHDYGGAIYADKICLAGSSYFEDNTAYDNHGGAIYTNILCGCNDNLTNIHMRMLWLGQRIKLSCDGNIITDAVFSGNTAGEDGGAIYINKKNKLTFSCCVFNNNHCGDEGGAIYLDSCYSNLTLVNNVFKGNRADDEGQCVFNCGYYGVIYNNFWNYNPSSTNGQLIEWKAFLFNFHHVDSKPSTFDFSLTDVQKVDVNMSGSHSRVRDLYIIDDIDFTMSVKFNSGTGYRWVVSPESYGVDLISTESVIDNLIYDGSSATMYFNFHIIHNYFYVKLILVSISGEIVDEIDSNANGGISF